MKNEIHFIKNYDLSKRSWIKSGGSIKVFIKPKKNEEIKKVLSYLNKEKSWILHNWKYIKYNNQRW